MTFSDYIPEPVRTPGVVRLAFLLASLLSGAFVCAQPESDYYIAAATRLPISFDGPEQSISWAWGWHEDSGHDASQQARNQCEKDAPQTMCRPVGIPSMAGGCMALYAGHRLVEGYEQQHNRLFAASSNIGRELAIESAKQSCEGWVHAGLYEEQVLQWECRALEDLCSSDISRGVDIGNSAEQPEPAYLGAAPQPACAEMKTDDRCWLELENHPGCYVWGTYSSYTKPSWGEGRTYFRAVQVAEWSGRCLDGYADGEGELSRGVQGEKDRVLHRGRMDQGKETGYWRFYVKSDYGNEGEMVDGLREGVWVFRSGVNTVNTGGFIKGLRQGHWVETGETIGGGRRRNEGPYVDDEKHGPWVERYDDWERRGSYSRGEKTGYWTTIYDDGRTSSGFYRNGKKVGTWTHEDRAGNIRTEQY